ncbi:hypothetical protein [Pseudoduganella namucuonensis]|uniref:hypothetical protein n=1 Tax=Pseudoduganella namucuonensis TaxID=1035707 RepID=UPI0011601F22|nr:hypothetical protein [Pseudoduganella namucuonensis]
MSRTDCLSLSSSAWWRASRALGLAGLAGLAAPICSRPASRYHLVPHGLEEGARRAEIGVVVQFDAGRRAHELAHERLFRVHLQIEVASAVLVVDLLDRLVLLIDLHQVQGRRTDHVGQLFPVLLAHRLVGTGLIEQQQQSSAMGVEGPRQGVVLAVGQGAYPGQLLAPERQPDAFGFELLDQGVELLPHPRQRAGGRGRGDADGVLGGEGHGRWRERGGRWLEAVIIASPVK